MKWYNDIRIIFLVFIFSSFTDVFAQETDKLEAVKESNTGKWGYAIKSRKLISTVKLLGGDEKREFTNESKDDSWIVPPLYDEVSKEFSENLAAVEINGKVGYIDVRNRFIIEPQFDEIDDLEGFSCGVSVVKQSGKYGYIDKKGNFIIPPTFEWAGNFKENLLASVKQDGKYGAIDITGQLVVPYKYKLEEAMITVPLSNKEYRKAAKELKEKKENGELDAYLAQLDSVNQYVNSLINDSTYRSPLPEHDFLLENSGRFVGIKRNDNFWALTPQYSHISEIEDGYILLEKDSVQGIADYNGRVLVPCEYDDVVYEKEAGVFVVRKDNLYGFYDRSGLLVVPLCLDAIDSFETDKVDIWLCGEKGWADNRGKLQEHFLDRVYNGGVRLEQSNQTVDARRLYNRILALEPDYALAYNNLGILDINIEDYREGMQKLKKAHELDPDNEMIAENLKQAKKDRSERRWNRVLKVFEVAGEVVNVAAATYNTVEAVKGTGNYIDLNGMDMSLGDGSSYSDGSASEGNYVNNDAELAAEQAKLQQLLREREMLVNQRVAMNRAISQQGMAELKNMTRVGKHSVAIRPGQRNYGSGVATRSMPEMSYNKVDIKNVDKKIAACRQRIRILKGGSEYSSSVVSNSSSSDDDKQLRTVREQRSIDMRSDFYWNCYNDLVAMKNRTGNFTNMTHNEIDRFRQERQMMMINYRKELEKKGEKIGNADSYAMETWVP